MAAQSNRKVPKIRFKGFEAEWEDELLGDIFTKIRNAFVGTATPYYTDKGHFYLQSNNVKNGEINRNTEVFINENFYLSQKDKWLRANDIVMVQSGHVGHTAVIPEELDNTAAHALIIISKPSRDVYSYFVNFYFQGNRAKRGLANITTGNTVKHILASDIKRFPVFFAHRDEQTQIGGYFQEVDRLIRLHQCKHAKLVMLKKAMLQKMFPSPGATIPEIRFKGFSGKWKAEAVSSLLTERNVQAPKSDQFPLMAFIAGQGVASKGKRYNREFLVSDEANKKYKQTELGDFIYSSNNLETGSIGINKFGSASISPVYSIFSITQNGDADFIGQLLCQKAFICEMVKWRQGVVYGQWRIHESDFLGIETTFPSVDEQQKIGTYFRQLDELISKHATQLQKLQQIKLACLEKMFV